VKPDSASVELNLASAMAGLGRQAEAGEHFHRSLALGDWPEQHYVYGIWLHSQGRSAEAQAQFETAIERNRFSFPARNMLMQIYSEKGDFEALDRLFQDTLRIAYNEEAVRRFRTARDEYEKSVKTRKAAQGPSPAALTRHAAELCQDRKYEECLEEAQKVIEIRPDYAEAYNNKAYALIAMNRLDEAIRDFKEAVRLKPDYTTAKNNLARALEQKRREEQPGRPAEPR
jgi:tetratricopeptide (TPR) repeat protein